MTLDNIGIRSSAEIGASFGGFQAMMLTIGWLGGSALMWLISGFDHWVAFLLLASIGGKMIYEDVRGAEERLGGKPLMLSHLILISIATSIDSLAVGLGFSVLGIPILLPAVLIGVVCFMISFTGAYFGNRVSKRLGGRVRTLGGVILILIGLRILFDHLGLIG